METSAELLYLLKEFDSKDQFGFKDELERNECLQWLFFWHGSVSPTFPTIHSYLSIQGLTDLGRANPRPTSLLRQNLQREGSA